MSFANIPHEMRSYTQFVCWRYENRGAKKLAKPLYSPTTNKLAKVTDPSTWVSFDEAVANAHRFDGIGFVFTMSDPFCFIDFDDPYERDENGELVHSDPAEIIRVQKEYEQKFSSYSEVSPSGRGLHIYCKGMVPEGRNVRPYEIYSSGRFGTLTGAVHRKANCNRRQAEAMEFWSFLSSQRKSTATPEAENLNLSCIASDKEVYRIAATAKNADKFVTLWKGDWNSLYESQSSADFALIDILGYYTQNREQITRMFRASGLGNRKKALRDKYVETMISKSFDRHLAPIDLSGLDTKVSKMKEQEGVEQRVKIDPSILPPVALPKHKPTEKQEREAFVKAPGLVGDIADYIYKQSWKPVDKIATVAAISFMAGLCGRGYNFGKSGLNLYILLLARTGRGKNEIGQGHDNRDPAQFRSYLARFCLLYTSPSPRDQRGSRMPSSA